MALNNNYSTNIGAIVLAAGESSRLGTPKQLLKYAGQSLLQHSAEAATASGAHPVVVVLGANADIIKKEFTFFLRLKIGIMKNIGRVPVN